MKGAVVGAGQVGGERMASRKDGTEGTVEASTMVLHNESGAASGYVSVVRDITDRRRADKALRESEEYFRSLIENASDIITVVGMDGIIRYESPAIERILGYAPDELLGQNVLKL